MVQIAPSIIAAKAEALRQEVEAVAAAGADMIHMDVMDGAFVPNITYGPWIHAGVHRVTNLPLDTHLMVEEPLRFLEDYAKAGADCLTVHVEACRHLDGTLRAIRQLDLKAGVTLNPGTPLETLEPVLDLADRVLIMSVNPGFAGQAFIPAAVGRVERVAAWRRERGLDFEIEVDGGVGPANALQLAQAGADILVAGSAIYKAPDYAQAIRDLRVA